MMNIHPNPAQETAIQEAIKAGLIGSEIDALDIGLELLRSQLNRFDNTEIPRETLKPLHEMRKDRPISNTADKAADLGKRLTELRQQAILNGMTLLNWDEVNAETQQNRGGLGDG